MAGERKRRHHQRSRKGCVTCKQRHMRCDETKPYCRNCLKSGGSCGYAGAESSNLNSPSLELNEERLQMQPWRFSPTVGLMSASRQDPFDSLEITLCRESSMLFDHYNNYRILTRTPTRRKVPGGESTELARSDQALMHTSILLAANHWVLLGGDPATISSALYYHKVEAIRIINERLDDPVKAGLVGTIGAVAAMTLSEISCGSTEIATHHLNGLEHLLKLGGVLHTKHMSGLLHRMILLADTLTSSATNSPPRFFGLLFEGDSSRRSSVSTFKSSSDLTPTSSNHSDAFSSDPLSGVEWEVAQMFHELQYLSTQVAAYESGILNGDPFELRDNMCSTEKLIDYLIHERIERIDTSEHHIEFAAPVLEKGNVIPVGACGRSAAIYVYLFLRKIPLHSPVFDWMVDITRQDFERTESCIRHMYPPELLFWLLFVAGTASLGRPDRSWFLMKLAKYRNFLKLDSWRAATEVLEKLAWLETPGESLGGSLWDELEGIH